MIDIVATQDKLETLADKFESNNAPGAMRLRELSAAVGQKPSAYPSAEDWLAADIYKVINPEALVEAVQVDPKVSKRRMNLIRFLEWLRNVLILAPLVLTWMGIWQASEKYNAYISSNPNAIYTPFISLWEQGFGNTLWSPFILSHLAIADFSLLALILILTGIVTWQFSVINARREQEAEHLKGRLSQALGDALMCLTIEQRRKAQQAQNQQPKDIEGVVRLLFDIVQEFKRVSAEFVRELAAERQQRGSLTDFTQKLQAVAQDMVNAANAMKQSNTELVMTVKDLSDPIKEIPKIMAAAGLAIGELNRMVGALNTLVADQAGWRQELETMLATHLDTLLKEQKTYNQEELKLLSNGFGHLMDKQDKASQNLQTTLKFSLDQIYNDQQGFEKALYTLIDSAFNKLLSEQRTLGSSLAQVVNMLSDALKDFDKSVKAIEQFTQEQTQLLKTMEMHKDAQRQMTEQMQMAHAEVAQILKSVREAVPELQSVSVNVSKFVGSLQRLPSTFERELLQPLAHYSSAAAKIDVGANTLAIAATSLQDAADKLNGHSGGQPDGHSGTQPQVI